MNRLSLLPLHLKLLLPSLPIISILFKYNCQSLFLFDCHYHLILQIILASWNISFKFQNTTPLVFLLSISLKLIFLCWFFLITLLNYGVLQGLFFGPHLSSSYTHSFGILICDTHLLRWSFSEDVHIYISIQGLSSYLQMCIFNPILNISIWISNRHFKINT